MPRVGIKLDPQDVQQLLTQLVSENDFRTQAELFEAAGAKLGYRGVQIYHFVRKHGLVVGVTPGRKGRQKDFDYDAFFAPFIKEGIRPESLADLCATTDKDRATRKKLVKVWKNIRDRECEGESVLDSWFRELMGHFEECPDAVKDLLRRTKYYREEFGDE